MEYEVPAYRVELVRSGGTNADQPYCRGPKAVARLFRAYVGEADREHLVAIFLDAQLRLIGIHTVSVGDLDHTFAHPREVFKAAILCNAASVVLAHNHPSGDPYPSEEDISLTRRLEDAGCLLDIEVFDHVIVGAAGHASLWLLGHLSRLSPPYESDEEEGTG